VVLASLSLLAAFALHAATGGREIAEDAPFLLGLARRPFVLFRSYVEARTGSNWGSFPPLLPLLFGAPIRPWNGLVSDFWTIRLGVLAWTALALLALERVLVRLEHVEPARVREALFAFALLPSTWGPAALLPQEESYVSLFALALYAAARAGRFRVVPALLVLTALSAKYFLLVLAVPLAFATPRPWRRLVAWGALAGGALAAYVGYHALRFDLLPIVSHRVAPTMSISVWGLLWHLGVQPALPIVSLSGVAGAGLAALAFSAGARARAIPLPYATAGALYLALLALPITAPAYVLWVVPLALICFARIPRARDRLALAGLMLAWSAGEWIANLSRGTALALAVDRGEARSAFAARMVELLGADFPFHGVHVGAIALVLASGAATVWLLWRAGRDEAARAPVRAGARAV
jgi:hypothetical protein